MGKDIVLFIRSLGVGGAERVTVNLANQLAENGHQVRILVLVEDGDLADKLVPEVDLESLSVNRLRWAVVPFVHYLRGTSPDILISSTTGANVLTIVAAQIARISATTIVIEHSTQSAKSRPSLRRDMKLAKHLYTFADHIVGVSNGVAEDVRGWIRGSGDKVTTIYNPVINEDQIGMSYDLPSHPWFHNDEIEIVLSVGRHTQEKDYPTLIKAFAQLLKEREDVRLMLLGDGELTSDYKSLIMELGIREEVALPGFVTQPFPFMAHSDVFALSSRVEGLSLVLIEAMACGTAVVSTDCPNGPSEVLANGKYGELVPTENSDALKEAINRTILNPLPAKMLQSRARDFSIRKATKQYESLFNRNR